MEYKYLTKWTEKGSRHNDSQQLKSINQSQAASSTSTVLVPEKFMQKNLCFNEEKWDMRNLGTEKVVKSHKRVETMTTKSNFIDDFNKYSPRETFQLSSFPDLFDGMDIFPGELQTQLSPRLDKAVDKQGCLSPRPRALNAPKPKQKRLQDPSENFFDRTDHCKSDIFFVEKAATQIRNQASKNIAHHNRTRPGNLRDPSVNFFDRPNYYEYNFFNNNEAAVIKDNFFENLLNNPQPRKLLNPTLHDLVPGSEIFDSENIIFAAPEAVSEKDFLIINDLLEGCKHFDSLAHEANDGYDFNKLFC